ncbi:hypothetical protein SNEBB_005510 [Seison nebaliae]|nr:hypothetical protein SNEBB_005510 [Seison nebaliae]
MKTVKLLDAKENLQIIGEVDFEGITSIADLRQKICKILPDANSHFRLWIIDEDEKVIDEVEDVPNHTNFSAFKIIISKNTQKSKGKDDWMFELLDVLCKSPAFAD